MNGAQKKPTNALFVHLSARFGLYILFWFLYILLLRALWLLRYSLHQYALLYQWTKDCRCCIIPRHSSEIQYLGTAPWRNTKLKDGFFISDLSIASLTAFIGNSVLSWRCPSVPMMVFVRLFLLTKSTASSTISDIVPVIRLLSTAQCQLSA